MLVAGRYMSNETSKAHNDKYCMTLSFIEAKNVDLAEEVRK